MENDVARFGSRALRELEIDLGLSGDLGGPLQVPEDHVRRVLSAGEVAQYCDVATDQVLDWIDSGRLRASLVPHDRYRIDTGDFLAFLQRFEIAI